MIESARLLLVPAARDALNAELADDLNALGAALGVRVDPAWPPDLYGPEAAHFMLDLLDRDPGAAEWGTLYFVLKGEPLTLIGVGGFKGAPRDGAVEIGYSVVAPHQRQGLATEAAQAMIARAFAEADMQRILAHTLPGLAASIGVLEKCGFKLQGDSREMGAIMYTLERADWRG